MFALRPKQDDAGTVTIGELSVSLRTALEGETEKYDIVVANIVADAIIALSASVTSFMTDDAVYIVSGIIDTRADDVKNAIKGHFEIVEENTYHGWYCFVLKKA